MNIVTRIISTAVENGFRIAKVLRFGKDDIQTADVVAPFGIDSNPIADMTAIYADTSDDEQKVIIGYINESCLAEPGELRLYSTDDELKPKAFLWLKKDGTLHLNGNADNAVRYSPLNTGLQSFKAAIQAELVNIAVGIATAGGSYTPGSLSVDISGSKIDTIKTA